MKTGIQRVLVFDRDKIWAEAAKEELKMRGFACDVEAGKFDSCRSKALQTVYSVAMINVHALEEAEIAIQHFASEFPATTIVLLQDRVDPDLGKLGWHQKQVYGSFVKNHHPISEIGDLVWHIVRGEEHPTKVKIVWPADLDLILKGYAESLSCAAATRGGNLSLRVLREELDLVVRKIFSDTEGGEPITKEIKVECFGPELGHSASSMFKLTPVISFGTAGQKSAVLKFGPLADIQQESRNYDQFVEWFLTVDQTVRKIGYAKGNRCAGILYSYPRDVVGGYTPYADDLRNHPLEECLAIIQRMFNLDNRRWLSVDATPFIPKKEAGFQTYYLNKVLHATIYEMQNTHLEDVERQMANLKPHVPWSCNANEITLPFLSLTVPNPVSFLSRPLRDGVKFTIIHGDLHGYNILIDQSGRYFFIDFFYTGFGDIYRDFIELELSVRYDLLCSRKLPDEKLLASRDSQQINVNGLQLLKRLEKALIQKTIYGKEPQDSIFSTNTDLAKAYHVICSIRDFARQNHPAGMKQYYMGLIYSALKSVKYFYPLDVKLYRLFLAGLYVQVVDGWKVNAG